MHLLRCPISLSGYNIADFVIYEVHLSGFVMQEEKDHHTRNYIVPLIPINSGWVL